MLSPLFVSGELVRIPHPTDRRARLIQLTDAGRRRMDHAIPKYTAAYRMLLDVLEANATDPEALFRAFDELRAGIAETADRIETEGSRTA
jgi:DNA-binding MarR family transcriptional regulator